MPEWINFSELRKMLTFEQILEYYKVEIHRRGNQHHGFCPLPSHNGKRNSPSFSANLAKGIWQCFGCGGKGNLLDFAVLMEGANPKSGEDVQRIALKLKEQFLGSAMLVKKSESEVEKHEENVIINAPLDFELKGLDAGHPYLLNRGFTPETIAKFGLGYCLRGLLKDRIAIPLHDATGQLIGYAGRVIDDSAITEENPKYRFPGNRKRKDVIYDFRKSLFLYNGYRITSPVDDLVVLEGFTGAWWLSQAGIANVVGVMGSSCSGEQANEIVSLVAPGGRVWVFTDGDKAGIRCAETILSQVAPHRFTRWVKVETGKQPTDFAPAELKKCFTF
jgi:DNA primase